MSDLITLSQAAKLTNLSFAVFNSAAAEGRIQTILKGKTTVNNRGGLGQANVPRHYLTREEAFRYADWFREHKAEILPFTTKTTQTYRATDDELLAAQARHTAELRTEAREFGLSFAEYKQLFFD